VNWDPVDNDRARQRTGDRRPRLAFGRWSSSAKLTQWFFRITAYADDLLGGQELERWPEKVR
jgi:leucyl-tRNA synthetase